MEFKQRIKKLRKERKFTQQHLANLLNMDKSSISKYETGVALPEPPIIEKLSDIFNVSVDYLLGRTDNRKSSLIKGYYKNNKVEIEIKNIILKGVYGLCRTFTISRIAISQS